MFYSSCGWLMEVLNTIRVEKRFVNRGFLIGPYCPIYGCGVVLMSILLKNCKDYIFVTFKVIVFFPSFIVISFLAGIISPGTIIFTSLY